MTKGLKLTEDAIVELVREGGIAWIPKLAAPRRFVLASMPPPLRARLCDTIRRVAEQARLPEQPDGPGRGDQFYYRIHIRYAQHQAYADVTLLIPEGEASEVLETWWRDGLAEQHPV